MSILANIILLATIAIVAVGCARFAFNRGVSIGRQQVLKEDLVRIDRERNNVNKQIESAINSIQPNGS